MTRAPITCPACGEDDDLSGRPADGQDPAAPEQLEISCGACGQTWERDLAPVCAQCGEADVRPALKAVVERSRGTQLSVTATEVVHLCPRCDADVLADYQQSRSPLMPDALPTVGPEQGVD